MDSVNLFKSFETFLHSSLCLPFLEQQIWKQLVTVRYNISGTLMLHQPGRLIFSGSCGFAVILLHSAPDLKVSY